MGLPPPPCRAGVRYAGSAWSSLAAFCSLTATWATLLLVAAALLFWVGYLDMTAARPHLPEPEVAPMLAAVGIAVCVGVVVVVWVAGALYNALHTLHDASHAPRERTRSRPGRRR